MMKKSLLLFSLFIFSFEALPQTQQFFDSPFGGGGGFTPGWTFANADDLNNMLFQANMPQVSSSGIFTTGGAGFFYIGFIPGLRIGGMGYGGSSTSKSSYTQLNTIYKEEAVYSIGGGGVTIEYTIPFIKSVGVSLGATIGGGGIGIELYKNKDNNTWNGMFSEFAAPSASTNNNIHRTLKNNYWIIVPTLNIDIPFYRFLCFRVGAGYNLTLGEKWKIDSDLDITGVPTTFNGKNFFIQTGIFVGFFSF
jgi:hypothetical protein